MTNILRSLRGRKYVFYDPQLSLHFDYLLQDPLGATTLKECSVIDMKELKSDDREAIVDTPSQISAPDFVLFIVYPNSSVIKSVAKITQLYRDSGSCLIFIFFFVDTPSSSSLSTVAGLRCAFHLYYIPHQTVLCAQILADKGVAASIAVHERSIGPAPVDADLLSLHLPAAYRQLHVDADHSSLGVVARALLHLQSIYGVIPNIKAVGNGARNVVQRMMHMRVEADAVAGASAPGSGARTDDAEAPTGKESIDTLVM